MRFVFLLLLSSRITSSQTDLKNPTILSLPKVVSTPQASLPPLKISTLQKSASSLMTSPVQQRPSSVPPPQAGFGSSPKRSNTIGVASQQSQSQTVRTNGVKTNDNSRNGSPVRSNSLPQRTVVDLTYGLGEKPELDMSTIQDLLSISPCK